MKNISIHRFALANNGEEPKYADEGCLKKNIDGPNEPMLPFGSFDPSTNQVVGPRNVDGLSSRCSISIHLVVC